MTWNYRTLRFEELGEVYYAIHEVHYDADGTPSSWAENPTTLVAEDRLDLLWSLARLAEAVSKPVLEEQNETLVECEPERQMSEGLVQAIRRVLDFSDRVKRKP